MVNINRWLILALIIGSAVLAFSGNAVENVDAHEMMVLQDAWDGEMHVYTDPGWKQQWFGKVTKYPLRAEYPFLADEASSKELQFNDGGKGWLYGAVSWEMPLDSESILKIHRKYGSAEAVAQQAVSRMIDSAIILAGPLMSSTESYGERRAELVHYINDQAENGVYVTVTETVKQIDPMTGDETVARVARIVLGADGKPRRQQDSILNEFNIRLLPISIAKFDYDDEVEKQIADRQKSTADVQQAQADARKAQQQTITVEEKGKQTAAEAKWTQEALKAKAIVEAEQRLEVARLDAEAAEQERIANIKRGQGEAERKRLVMSADGALEKKLQTYEAVNFRYAEAIEKYQGAWVPTIAMGGQTGGGSMNGANDLLNLLTVKTAKDLSLDLRVQGK